MMRLSADREQKFPALAKTNYIVTSIETSDYNCIAWAAGKADEFWWPMPPGWVGYTWPIDNHSETVDCFIEAFSTLGYELCDSSELEEGFEKVALFANSNEPTHMARQLKDGSWTSKCGEWEDISHDLEAVGGIGTDYGTVSKIMRRKRL